MTIKELRKLSADKLQSELEAAHREIFNLRMQRASGQMHKNHLFGAAKLRIARINTLLNEKVKP